MSFFKLQVLGRVGRDPETRTTQQGKHVVGFSVAVDIYDPKATNNKGTQWIGVQSWNEKQQRVIESFVRKGGQVLLEGVPSVRSWEKDGRTNVSLEMDISWGSLTLVGKREDSEERVPDNAGSTGRSSRAAPSERAPASRQPSRTSDLIDDDIPF